MTNIIGDENLVATKGTKITVIDPAIDPNIESNTKAVLEAINSGGGQTFTGYASA